MPLEMKTILLLCFIALCFSADLNNHINNESDISDDFKEINDIETLIRQGFKIFSDVAHANIENQGFSEVKETTGDALFASEKSNKESSDEGSDEETSDEEFESSESESSDEESESSEAESSDEELETSESESSDEKPESSESESSDEESDDKTSDEESIEEIGNNGNDNVIGSITVEVPPREPTGDVLPVDEKSKDGLAENALFIGNDFNKESDKNIEDNTNENISKAETSDKVSDDKKEVVPVVIPEESKEEKVVDLNVGKLLEDGSVAYDTVEKKNPMSFYTI